MKSTLKEKQPSRKGTLDELKLSTILESIADGVLTID